MAPGRPVRVPSREAGPPEAIDLVYLDPSPY